MQPPSDGLLRLRDNVQPSATQSRKTTLCELAFATNQNYG